MRGEDVLHAALIGFDLARPLIEFQYLDQRGREGGWNIRVRAHLELRACRRCCGT